MINNQIFIRAFTADGYHRDIAILSEMQVHQHDLRVSEETHASTASGLIGVGVGIDPSKFPEVVRFEIVVKEVRR